VTTRDSVVSVERVLTSPDVFVTRKTAGTKDPGFAGSLSLAPTPHTPYCHPYGVRRGSAFSVRPCRAPKSRRSASSVVLAATSSAGGLARVQNSHKLMGVVDYSAGGPMRSRAMVRPAGPARLQRAAT